VAFDLPTAGDHGAVMRSTNWAKSSQLLENFNEDPVLILIAILALLSSCDLHREQAAMTADCRCGVLDTYSYINLYHQPYLTPTITPTSTSFNTNDHAQLPRLPSNCNSK